MSKRKTERLVAAGTATGVVLLFILIGVMTYQLLSMNSKKRESERLIAEITELQKSIEDGREEIDVWLTKWKIEERARQKGYIYKGNADE